MLCVIGVVFIMPLLGGVVSDAWAGKFRTIVGSGFIYVLGELDRCCFNPLTASCFKLYCILFFSNTKAVFFQLFPSYSHVSGPQLSKRPVCSFNVKDTDKKKSITLTY